MGHTGLTLTLFPAAIFLQAGGDKAAFKLARLQIYNF